MSGYVVGLTFRRLPSAGHTTLLVALALAEQADGEGNKIYPSIDLIATETRLSRRSVQYSISELEDMGFLVLVRRGGGRNQTNEWRIDLVWLEKQTDLVVAMRREKEQKNRLPQKGARLAPLHSVDNQPVADELNGARDAHQTCKNSATANAHNPPTPSPACKPPPPVPVDELVEAALWDARANTTVRHPARYRGRIRTRLGQKIEDADIETWRRWMRWQEDQSQINAMRPT